MAQVRAPKQWCLTKQETITSFESWRQNLQYTLSLDPNFAPFLVEGFQWERKTNTNPERGFTDDGESVPEAKRRTAAQKVIYLELMLGQIANFCPIISRNTIVKNATSIKTIWQTIRLHFGFQSTGAHFLDFDSIQLQPGERPEDLYQRLSSFIEDNTLKKDGGLSHMGTVPDEDEEITPTVENLVVLTWLRLIDNRLPALVKQRYGTELRSRTLATLKPEISLALDSLLDEIHAVADAKVMRSAFKGSKDNGKFRSISRATPSCPLCKQAGRRSFNHFLSKCKFLPEEDKRYLSSVRQTVSDETAGDPEIDQESYEDDNQQSQCYGIHSATSRRVSTKQSPTLKTFYKHFPLNVTLDTGAEINMLKLSVAHYMGVPIKKSNQRALQADGSTPLKVAGETHIVLTRGEQSLTVEALVVENLDVDLLGGIPFMATNDIMVRPAKQQIVIHGSDTVFYAPEVPDSVSHSVRRTQAFVLRSSSNMSSITWPGSYLEVTLPDNIDPDGTLAIEPKFGASSNKQWPLPQVIEAVSGQGGFRLVTAFADVGRYAKPQPSLMPDVDTILRTIGQWTYIIVTDLTSAFYQIPLLKESMKYCGVATPYKGIRVYTRCAMGMPGSETALEELMCRVLGDLLQEGVVAKLADDLYIGGNTTDELLANWTRVLDALQKNNLKLKPTKTIICPRSTTILGWIWSQGKFSASPHRIASLSACPPPQTVHGLRSYIGAYKVLGRVLPGCSQLIAPLDNITAGGTLQTKSPTDQLWIVTDGSVKKRGIGATLYVTRHGKLLLAGFFSAKLRKHQVTWLPCEIEALGIAAAVKHFSPYIIQSSQQTCVLTDSKPCVQAIDKLCRGEFSASPRVTSFLSVVSRYQVHVKHLAGSANVPSDFASRNAPECENPTCQICTFIHITEDSVVRAINIEDVLNSKSRLPFTSRSAWKDIQSECQDLRRVHSHLLQGTRPSKKLTNVKDVKRYLNSVSIAKDGILVVKHTDPLVSSVDLIVVPRSAIDGLITALHIKLDHPSKHQILQVLKRHFYALDMSQAVERVTDMCHSCASLRKLPTGFCTQSSEDPPEVVGMSFAADVMKRT
ncbi:uncharacterized protein LOC132734055 [Ruditapes philippinarum]|uniref:uncharacterized protein LOC132734055 n=1 Tax=Ruditapes philippinarum TaxID=129788 RepID=UPI00295B093A|nr:uncharacterized protein LOC132734055 [Ruditapes philippinarum]